MRPSHGTVRWVESRSCVILNSVNRIMGYNYATNTYLRISKSGHSIAMNTYIANKKKRAHGQSVGRSVYRVATERTEAMLYFEYKEITSE